MSENFTFDIQFPFFVVLCSFLWSRCMLLRHNITQSKKNQ